MPFRVEPLSAATVEITHYPGGETKRVCGDEAEELRREFRELYDSSSERKLATPVTPTLTADGAIYGLVQYDTPLLDIEDGVQSWTIARGLHENEALLLASGTSYYRVPNQRKMLLFLKNIGVND